MAELEPEPWPGLNDTDAELYYNVGKMRAIAEDLEIALALTQGAGGNRNGVTGSIETLTTYFSLGEEHIGSWPAASAFARSVGSTEADPGGQVSLEGRGQRLAALYKDYVECCQKLVQAIRDSADGYAKTNPGRE
ncbi:hypothetical protein ACIBIZ_01395 [Nonomuraea spiralis]|uniref:Uncharacterized protein n=1 Tax=Nonomuraea spiralis TaxID=46182 RepID=A0ABV5IQ24_9ACTN|nr:MULTISPECIES: hypothetical protein [Nonomuraea]RSN14676.1 hypothetical protein DMB42_09395 [Nonomuraea sp. WAC 01424]GGT15341.1 hypothetical protein GCM10010176_070040 [Nonomuraea spiralis]